MRTENDLRLAVQTGAFFLDKTEHDWVDKVRIDSISIRSPCYCILGQLHGNFWQVFEQWRHGVNTYEETWHIAKQLGFACDDEEESTLEKFWIEEITKRRQRP